MPVLQILPAVGSDLNNTLAYTIGLTFTTSLICHILFGVKLMPCMQQLTATTSYDAWRIAFAGIGASARKSMRRASAIRLRRGKARGVSFALPEPLAQRAVAGSIISQKRLMIQSDRSSGESWRPSPEATRVEDDSARYGSSASALRSENSEAL